MSLHLTPQTTFVVAFKILLARHRPLARAAIARPAQNATLRALVVADKREDWSWYAGAPADRKIFDIPARFPYRAADHFTDHANLPVAQKQVCPTIQATRH